MPPSARALLILIVSSGRRWAVRAWWRAGCRGGGGFRFLGSQGWGHGQAGQGAARSRAKAMARWAADGQSLSSLSCQVRPERIRRAAMLRTR